MKKTSTIILTLCLILGFSGTSFAKKDKDDVKRYACCVKSDGRYYVYDNKDQSKVGDLGYDTMSGAKKAARKYNKNSKPPK